jgi:hypothetical protein
MPISKASIEKLKALGIDTDAIINAAKDPKEIDVTIPDGIFMTEAQLSERDGVKVSEGVKQGETQAKTALIKEVASKAGLNITGERMADLVNGIKEGLSKDKDAAFTALQQQNQGLLQDNESLKAKATQAEMQLKNGMFELEVLSKLPANSLGFTQKEIFEVAKMRGYKAEQTENGRVWSKNGEILKDPVTHAPMAEDKAISHIWESEKFVTTSQPPAGGRGAQGRPLNGATSSFNKMSEVKQAFQEQYPNEDPNSPAFVKFYQQARKDNPDINVHE